MIGNLEGGGYTIDANMYFVVVVVVAVVVVAVVVAAAAAAALARPGAGSESAGWLREAAPASGWPVQGPNPLKYCSEHRASAS